MNIAQLAIRDLIVFQPQIFKDDRGYFFESFNQAKFEKTIGYEVNFVQDNHSYSHQNILRGLHYQIDKSQSKLIRVVQGEIFDVVVDIRSNSPSFGQWVGQILSAANNKHFWIPKGFAHGFLVLSESAIVNYKVTDYYHPASEQTIIWDDATIGIKWPIQERLPIISPKDKMGKAFLQTEYF